MKHRIRRYFKNDNFKYQGFSGIDSVCKLEIWRDETLDGILNKYIVLLTELSKNRGTSITNSIEYLATIIYRWLELVDQDKIVFIEHYPIRGIGYRQFRETYSIVTFMYKDGKFHFPRWRFVEKSFFSTLVGGLV